MSTSQIAEPPVAAESSDDRREVIELDVTGMSCGSCVARVQSALSAAPGVAEARVNFATGRATVDVGADSTDAQQLVEAVERIGYGARAVDAGARSPAESLAEIEAAEATDRAGWLRRVIVAVPLAAVVVALTYSAPHDVTARWLTAALTVPIQFWCGLPFLRGAWVRARAHTTNMDTVSAAVSQRAVTSCGAE